MVKIGLGWMAVVVPACVLATAPDPRTQSEGDGSDSSISTVKVIGEFRDHTKAATKTDTPLREIPQSITVITQQQIVDQNANNLQEVLRYTSGIRSDMYGLDNRGDWFTMRGGSEGSTLLDGLRLPLSGSWGVVRNEPHAFERVEVLRGPASLIAGQNGPGGVVNLVSKRPKITPSRELALQFGNRDHKQLSADLAGPLNAAGTLLYSLVGLGRQADTQVDHAFDERSYVAPAISWRRDESTTVTLYSEYQRDESGNTEGFFPWQGTLLPAPNGRIPVNTFIGEPDWDTYGGYRLRAGYEMQHRLNDVWSLRHDLRYDTVSGRMRTMYAAWWDGFVDADGNPDSNGRHLNRIWYANDDESRVANADLLLEGHLQLAGTQHKVLFGADGMRARNAQKSWDGAATPLDVYLPVYGSFPAPELEDVAATRNVVRQHGFLVQDQIKIDERWVLIAGLRHDSARSEVDGATDGDASAWSKNFGLVHLFDSGWSPYASYSESFESVGGRSAAGHAFKPKRGEQIEAGVKWAPKGVDLVATAAAYRLEEKNRLTTDSANPNFSIQRGAVTVRGAELEATGELQRWRLTANYTYADARQTSVSDLDIRYLDKQLHAIPQHSAALWAVRQISFRGLDGFRLGAGIRYVGETWDGTDSLATPSNTIVDAMAAWDNGNWRYALNVSNLTDKIYVATCLERGDCWFGTRREIAASAAYRF